MEPTLGDVVSALEAVNETLLDIQGLLEQYLGVYLVVLVAAVFALAALFALQLLWFGPRFIGWKL